MSINWNVVSRSQFKFVQERILPVVQNNQMVIVIIALFALGLVGLIYAKLSADRSNKMALKNPNNSKGALQPELAAVVQKTGVFPGAFQKEASLKKELEAFKNQVKELQADLEKFKKQKEVLEKRIKEQQELRISPRLLSPEQQRLFDYESYITSQNELLLKRQQQIAFLEKQLDKLVDPAKTLKEKEALDKRVKELELELNSLKSSAPLAEAQNLNSDQEKKLTEALKVQRYNIETKHKKKLDSFAQLKDLLNRDPKTVNEKLFKTIIDEDAKKLYQVIQQSNKVKELSEQVETLTQKNKDLEKNVKDLQNRLLKPIKERKLNRNNVSSTESFRANPAQKQEIPAIN